MAITGRARTVGASASSSGGVVAVVLALVAALLAVPAAEHPAVAQDATPAQSGDPDPVLFDDPLLEFQWYLDRTRTREAWSLTPGLSSVTIGVIDTGVDAAHQDLDGAFWIDSDGANGYDYLRGTSVTYVGADRDWHGTAVAGVVGARADDGYGIAGVAPGVSLLVARIYESASTEVAPRIEGYASAAQAIGDVADAGADVILLTWGGTEPNDELFDAIAAVDVPVVVAAGNDGVDLSGSSLQRYPAAYQLPNLVTVAASERNGELLDNGRLSSNYGFEVVDIAAPGVDIVSLAAEGQHQLFEGTSFAAPQVAAALGLGRSFAPAATTGELIGELLRTARRSPALNGKVASGGELDALAFLQALERPVCTPGLPPTVFDDVSRRSVHVANIDCVVFHRVSLGVSSSTFIPARRITRGEMASFLARSLRAAGYDPEPLPLDRAFPDTGGSVHADAIDTIAAAGITVGRTDGTYASNERVPRGQMTTFLVRTVELLTDQELAVDRQWFSDIDGHTHERSIRIARDVGITIGGSQAGAFDPDSNVSRAQMASFVARMLDALGRQGITVRQLPPSS